MLKRSVFAVTLSLITAHACAQDVQYVGSFTWMSADALHGGFSGLELNDNGRDFVAISDRGSIVSGTLSRDENGRISDVRASKIQTLKSPNEKQHKRPANDAEGLAIGKNGAIYISFEGVHRVSKYTSETSNEIPLPAYESFATLQDNSGLEALAIDTSGRLFTLPERSGGLTIDFPIYMFSNGQWSEKYAAPRRGNFLPVGMDIGPDGKLYILERWFRGLGFSSRVRRFDMGKSALENEITLIDTGFGAHDNLEGISVWNDGTSIRITMISDNNFKPFQVNEFVEYRVTE